MKLRRIYTNVCLILLVGVMVTGSAWAATPPKKVPQLTVDNYLKTISSSQGKVVLINIFASWCAPCRIEVPTLINIRNAFAEQDLVMLGVSVDKAPGSDKGVTPKALTAFLQEIQIPYPIYLSAPGFEDALSISAVPQLLIYDKTGKLVINYTGLAAEDDLRQVLQKLINQE